MDGNSTPTGADMVQAVTNIDRAIKDRRDSDKVLINFWLYFFLVSWVTLGIYTIVLFFQRVNRIDRFSERKHTYYQSLIVWTSRNVIQNPLIEAASRAQRDISGTSRHAACGN